MRLRTLLFTAGLAAGLATSASGSYQLTDEPLWRLAPGDRDYVTFDTYYERGLAFNPMTGNVYLTHFNHDTDTLVVPIVDGADGSDLGELSTAGISGGFRPLRMMDVTDDGVIFGGNMILGSSGENYKLYRWENEAADPEVVWEGDPSDGSTLGSERHYGHNISVRGSADTTIEVLIVPDFGDDSPHVVALLTSTDGGDTFELTNIETEPTQKMNLGAAFGAGETFWGTRAGGSLYELDFEGNILREFDGDLIDNMISPIAIDPERDILAVVGSWNPHLRIYNMGAMSTESFNSHVTQKAFPDPNSNVERTGTVAIGPNAVYALDTNNGVLAYGLLPPPPEDPNLTWQLLPGQRSYVTTDYTERGLAYNAATGNVYLTHWDGSSPVVPILDGLTGQDLGTLSVSGISGGHRSLRMIGVSDDGKIFGGNQTTDSASDPYRLYRWDSETSDPVLVWEGDPSGGIAGMIRGYGTNIAVRGGDGAPIEIFLAPDYWQQVSESHVVAHLSSTDGGETFDVEYVETDPTTRFGLGTAFGDGNSFWGTRAGQPLREFDFDGNLLREFDGEALSTGLSPIGINPVEDWFVGIVPGAVEVYDLAAMTTDGNNVPVVNQSFPTSNENVERTGELAFGADGMIYALDTNNGVIAFVPSEASEPVTPGELFWTNSGEVRTGDPDGAARTSATNLSRAIGVAVDPENGYLFWAEDAGGRIQRSNLDGSDATTIVTLEVEGGTGGQFLDVNPSLERVYWAEWTKGLFSANYDGSDVQQLLAHDSQSTGVTVNRETGDVYFGSAATGDIWRMDADGSNQTMFTWFGENTYGIAVDPVRNRLYYTNFSSGTLSYQNLDTQSDTQLFSGLGEPLGVAVADDGNRIYWVERTGGRVMTASVDDSGAGPAEELFTGEDSPFGITSWTKVDGGFEEWAASHNLPEDQGGPTDDPDGDGISNLLEYALGLNPGVADVTALPVAEVYNDNGQEYLMLTVEKDPDVTDVELRVEVSGDLAQWESGTEHTTVLEDSATLLQVRDNTPIGEGDRRFIRAVVLK